MSLNLGDIFLLNGQMSTRYGFQSKSIISTTKLSTPQTVTEMVTVFAERPNRSAGTLRFTWAYVRRVLHRERRHARWFGCTVDLIRKWPPRVRWRRRDSTCCQPAKVSKPARSAAMSYIRAKPTRDDSGTTNRRGCSVIMYLPRVRFRRVFWLLRDRVWTTCVIFSIGSAAEVTRFCANYATRNVGDFLKLEFKKVKNRRFINRKSTSGNYPVFSRSFVSRWANLSLFAERWRARSASVPTDVLLC